jgi:hypothetical protein
MDKREEWVAARAYQLWEGAGQPEGQHHEHWKQASDEWDDQQGSLATRAGSPAAWDDDEQ